MPEDGADGPISLSLLGRFSLFSESGPGLIASSPRQQALIAYLALQPSLAAGRERLCGLLWGDLDEHNARQNLRQIVFRLRRELAALASDAISADRDRVWLDPAAFVIDVRDFEQLAAEDDPGSIARAIDLYGGDFLSGSGGEAEGFHEWAAQERARLRVMFHALVERYASDPGTASSAALNAVNRVVALDPFDEGGHRLLLQTIARHYGPQAALTRADLLAAHLRKEGRAGPDAETRALIARLRATLLQPAATASEEGAAAAETPRLFENVPPRDLNFIGRDGVLDLLRERLNDGPGQSGAVIQAAIHGLGGIGKTTLAAEYAHRHADDYSGVWWARAEQRALLVESLARLAARLNPNSGGASDPEKAAAAALARLSRFSKPFLLIYDNVDSPETLQNLIPSSGARVIITSRWADWSGRATELKLDAFAEETAAAFLQKRAGRNDPEGAGQLARALGCLPLALDHAGAYCRLTASSFAGYLAQIDARIARAPQGVAYPTSIAATFGLAIETAIRQRPSAEKLLGLFAYLEPDGIPLALAADSALGEEERAEALAALYAVSLIEYAASDNGEISATLHPLVQAAMRARLAERGEASAALGWVATQLARAFPASVATNPAAWPTCAMLLRHVLALRRHPGWSASEPEAANRLLHDAAGYLYARYSSFHVVESLLREAIALGEASLGAKHPLVVKQRYALALVFFFTGRLGDAEALIRRTIVDGEATLGRDHIDVALRLEALAELLTHTERYEEAEPLYREVIAIADRDAHKEQSYDMMWRNDFGYFLDATSRYAEAEPVFREALAIGERKLGRRHPEFARCLNNFGRALRRMGRYAQAEPLVREALAIWRGTIGANSAFYGRGQHNLAYILLRLGRPQEALALAESGLAIHLETLGVDHFYTRDSARRCAEAYAVLGRVSDAETMRVRFDLPAFDPEPVQTG